MREARQVPQPAPGLQIPEQIINAVCPVCCPRGEAVQDSVQGIFPNNNYIRPVSGAGSIATYRPAEDGYLAWSCALLAAHRGRDSEMEVMTAGLKTGAVTGRTLEAAGGRGLGPGSAGRVEEVGLCARVLATSFSQTASWWAQSQG